MIILAIGSNLPSKFGNRFKNIELVIKNLEEKDIEVINKSSFYETPSYPDKNNPKFINVVIEVKTKLSPVKLASNLILIEKIYGRTRNKKNDPRTIDIDIIDYKNEVINFMLNDLNFYAPHKELKNRNFVLYPLKEIKPNWIHPSTNEHINTLIDKLPQDVKKSILKVEKY